MNENKPKTLSITPPKRHRDSDPNTQARCPYLTTIYEIPSITDGTGDNDIK